MRPTEKISELVRRPRVLVLLGAATLWTLYWGVSAVQDVLAETAVGRGEAGPTLEAWEALQVVIVSAYSGVRWAAGIALVAGILVILELRQRTRTSSG